jgi:hypothetical protein
VVGGSMVAGTGTVTGATYDLSLAAPGGPTERPLIEELKHFLVVTSTKFYGQGGAVLGNPAGSGGEGIIAIYELLS